MHVVSRTPPPTWIPRPNPYARSGPALYTRAGDSGVPPCSEPRRCASGRIDPSRDPGVPLGVPARATPVDRAFLNARPRSGGNGYGSSTSAGFGRDSHVAHHRSRSRTGLLEVDDGRGTRLWRVRHIPHEHRPYPQERPPDRSVDSPVSSPRPRRWSRPSE